MILIVTHSQDLTADFVIRHLNADHLPYLRLNTDRLGTPECHFSFEHGPRLHWDGNTISVDDVGSVWFRRFALPATLESTAPKFRDFVRRELTTAMDAFFESVPQERTINTAEADRLAGNRLLQSLRAQRVGFPVPASLVTQNVERASLFLAEHQAVVTKALSYGRVVSADNEGPGFAYTSLVDRHTDLSGLAVCPTLFQERIPKRFEWRVTTIGEQLFSARIDASREPAPVDWRQRPDVTGGFETATLPASVIEALHRLCFNSRIVYGAHDLLETPNGEFFFLETNPAGQWAWLETTLRLPIGRAIADELARRAGLTA